MSNLSGTDITVLSTVIPAIGAAWHVLYPRFRPWIVATAPKVIKTVDTVAADIAPALTDQEREALDKAIAVIDHLGPKASGAVAPTVAGPPAVQVR